MLLTCVLKLILGILTEQAAWLLFENEIIPEGQQTNNPHFDAKMFRLSFRYNYVEITGSVGRVGFTIYDLGGFTD